MNRRAFFRLLGIGAASVAAAPVLELFRVMRAVTPTPLVTPAWLPTQYPGIYGWASTSAFWTKPFTYVHKQPWLKGKNETFTFSQVRKPAVPAQFTEPALITHSTRTVPPRA